MAHIEDRWTRPGPNGRRIKTDRHGRGKRWQAVWTDTTGARRKRAFHTRDTADHCAPHPHGRAAGHAGRVRLLPING